MLSFFQRKRQRLTPSIVRCVVAADRASVRLYFNMPMDTRRTTAAFVVPLYTNNAISHWRTYTNGAWTDPGTGPQDMYITLSSYTDGGTLPGEHVSTQGVYISGDLRGHARYELRNGSRCVRVSGARSSGGSVVAFPTAGANVALAGATYTGWASTGNLVSDNNSYSNLNAIGMVSGRDHSVRLVDSAGTVVGDDKADSVALYGSADNGVATYGGASDKWGVALTEAMVKDSDFGVVLSCLDLTAPGYTDYLRASGYNFSTVPAGATIDGITVDIERDRGTVMTNPAFRVDYIKVTVHWSLAE